jgi:lipopolysaccharide transport system permease protein
LCSPPIDQGRQLAGVPSSWRSSSQVKRAGALANSFSVEVSTLAGYELRIRPNRNWLRLDWRGLWEYRDLLFLLIRRDFLSKYRQTVLGPTWFIIQPLLTTAIFTVIFGNLAKLPTDRLPPMLFYLCGMLGWSYFANNFNSTATILVANAAMFGKVYFPRLIVPLSTIASNLFAFIIQLLTFLGFWIYFKYFTASGGLFQMRWQVVMLPLLVLHIGALSMGVGLWLSAFTAKYRDFNHLLGFLIQLWMYATPVIFPLSMIPEQWQWVVVLNPMSMPLEAMRWVFLGHADLRPFYYFISVLVSLFILVTGLLVFQNVERTFVDSV